MLLLDMSVRGIDARVAERALEQAHIAVSCMGVPGRPGGRSSGLRLGTPAMTTRGLREAETVLLGEWIADVLDAPGSGDVIAAVAAKVGQLSRDYPVYA
jgi:glycine hydroxymethyltransferase